MRARIWSLATASVFALATAAGARAEQPPASAAAPETTLGEVVVTGTLLRGVAPSGTEVIGINDKQIVATGAVNTNQLMASQPQVTNQFNTLPIVGTTTVSQIQVNRLNLRDLPGGNTQTGNATLLLVDGHRIASAGVNQFAPDADVVPPSVLERVEVVPDGGSSIYGTDAVGGVINLITKRRIDGFHVDAKAGVADHYNSFNSDLSGGKAWDSGSAYLAWDYQHNKALRTRYRDYAKSIDWTTGIPTGRQCDPPNISVGAVNYAYPGLQPGTVNACDRNKTGTLFPEQTRNSVFGGVSQDFGDRVKVDLRGFYTVRDTTAPQGPVRVAANVTPANPFYINIPSAPGATQNAQFTLGPVFGDSAVDRAKLREWGVTPTITADLGHRWELRTLLNFGGSHSTFNTPSANPALLNAAAAGTTVQTAINPYNIAATPNQQLLNNIADFALAGESFVKMTNLRAIADGPVIALPGGDVRAAVGVEYLRNNLRTRNNGAGSSAAAFEAQPFLEYTQSVKSVFGELQVPIIGDGNALPGIHALNVSGSVRYDKYSDFGNTTNPKVGVTYEPVEWITLRGSWGKSFNAPTPVDQLGSLQNTLSVQNFFVPTPVGTTAPPGAYVVALLGSAPNLQPQTAKEYSFGGDIRWPWVDGLRTSVSYYHIDYNGLLSRAPVFNPTIFFPNFPGFYILNPTAAQISAAAAQVKGGAAQVAQFLQPGGPPVFEILDFRTNNIGRAKVSGIDFSSQYRRDTDFGGWDISLSGNWELTNETTNPGSPPADNLAISPALRLATTVGVDYGQLRAQLTLNHLASYKQTYSVQQPQDSIGAFNVVNLFFRYDMEGEGWRKNLSFTLNLDNIFNTDPPVYKLTGDKGFTNGATLGRLAQFGVHKDF